MTGPFRRGDEEILLRRGAFNWSLAKPQKRNRRFIDDAAAAAAKHKIKEEEAKRRRKNEIQSFNASPNTIKKR